MDLMEVSRGEKRRTFIAAISVALMVMLVGAPVVQAAVQAVKVKGAVKVKDSTGDVIESKAIGTMGLLEAPGSDGAIAVRNYAGGGGFLGAGDCTASTEPAAGPLANTVTLSGGKIVTGIIITGTGTVRVTSDAIGNGLVPLANFTVSNQDANEFVGLGNGLTVTAPLKFTGIDGTACNFVILGQ